MKTVSRFSVFAVLLLVSPARGEADTTDRRADTGDATPAESEEQSDQPDTPKFDLQYKFHTGDVIRYSVDHRASIRSTIDETTQKAQTRTESVKAWKIIDVMPDGEIELINVVEHVRMRNHLPDRAVMEYDSKKDETPPPGFEDAAKAIGVPLSKVRMTPRGEMLDREIKHHQPAANDNAPFAPRLPDEPVAVGETWDEPQDLTVQQKSGGTKAVSTRRHYKLVEVINGIATIEASYQVLSPINAHIEAQLVQRLMKGKLRFDVEQGRLLSQRMDVDKRILGFAGSTSSMHYIMRMEEKLLPDTPEVAKRPDSTE